MGPKKLFETFILIPITREMKEALQKKAGHKNMAQVVRNLIESFLKGVDNGR